MITAENADEHWSLLLRAARLASTRPGWPDAGDYIQPESMSQSKWIEAHHKVEASDAAVLSLARRARVVWEQSSHKPSPETGTAVPVNVTDCWRLREAIAEGAIYSQSRGDQAEAIRRLRDLVHTAASLYRNGGLGDVMMGVYFDRSTTLSIHYSVAGLAGVSDPEVRRELESLLAELCDETPLQRAVDAVPCWRQPVFDCTDVNAAGNGFNRLLAPLANRTKARWAIYVSRMSEAAQAESLPAARRAMPLSTWVPMVEGWHYMWEGFPRMPSGHPPTLIRWLYLDWVSNDDNRGPEDLSPIITLLFESRMARRSAAAAIAVHLFRADAGRWPVNLEQLVPAYLPSVPIDICAGDSATMQYLVLQDSRFPAGQRPVLYYADQTPIRMGIDGLPADIHRHLPSQPDWPLYRPLGYAQQYRQYRDLARLSSPQSVNNNPNKPNAAGQNPKQGDGGQ
ncbi:MAG: hypothetical protein ACHRHE_00030 [Tepidisphaerales bacterium]